MSFMMAVVAIRILDIRSRQGRQRVSETTPDPPTVAVSLRHIKEHKRAGRR